MASYNFAPYQGASYCTHKAQPGNIYLSIFIEEQFPETRLLNIESCRDIVGGNSLSHHAEGRANDEWVPQYRTPSGVSVGEQIVRMLGPHGEELGIDHIIANLAPWLGGRGQPRTWSAAYPLPRGKQYTGLHPHKDHDHIGLTRVAARDLTLTKIRQVVLGTPAPQPPKPPKPPKGPKGDPMLGLNIGKKGDPPVKSLEAKTLQVMLKSRGFPNLEVNGEAGDATRSALHNWKVQNGITAANSGGEGIVGAYEYAKFNPPQV